MVPGRRDRLSSLARRDWHQSDEFLSAHRQALEARPRASGTEEDHGRREAVSRTSVTQERWFSVIRRTTLRGRVIHGPLTRGRVVRGQLMKYTLLITQDCNLACKYCYIGKKADTMPHSVATKVIDFVFANALPDEGIKIGFFGGEPLLQLGLIKAITELIENHPSYDRDRVRLAVVTNGTIFSAEIADFVRAHDMSFGVSCDGPPQVHDLFRSFPNGQPSSPVVEQTIREALEVFGLIPVNVVYHPRTLRYLPESVEYLASLGVRQVYLNPDFSAPWTEQDADLLSEVYGEVAERYMKYYLDEDPRFISLIDAKIAVILRGGYAPLERCRMGKGEFAFTPDGRIYPCERLVGMGGEDHCIGNVNNGSGVKQPSCHTAPGQRLNPECLSCGLSEYCMNWCGCSNYFSSGYYNRVGPFLCASERAAIETSFHVFETLEKKMGPTFVDHAGGLPFSNSYIIF